MTNNGFNKNSSGETLLLILISGLSKVLSFVREILLAFFFGASALLDSYYAGTAVSTFSLFLFSGGSFVPLLIAFFNQDESKNGEDKKKLNVFLLILVGLSVFFALFINFRGELFLGGVRDSIKAEALTVLKITSWATVFYCISSIVRARLNALEQYRLSGLQDLVMILVVIIGILLASKSNSLIILTYSFLLSAIARLLVQLPSLVKFKDDICWKVDWDFKAISNYFKIFLPMTLVVMIPQIQLVFSRNIAAGLEEGSLSGLIFAERTSEIVKSVIAFSIGTVVVPRLTKAIRDGKTETFRLLMSKSLRYVFFLSIPLFFVFSLYSRTIVTFLYDHGSFDKVAVDITTSALTVYSLAALLSSPIFIIINGYFASKNWQYLLVINLLGITFGISSIFLGLDSLGVVAIVLGTGIYSVIVFIASMIGLKRRSLLDLSILKELFVLILINGIAFGLGKLLGLWVSELLSLILSGLLSLLLLVISKNKTYLEIKQLMMENWSRWKLKKY